ncbi:DCR2 [Candida margitis]|uniref:DCR2 n=1 Tax=Candida margitis TaxID=1775924 RepID=UPI0022264A6F|nr:DCR2 [Candida margitis]KAI5953950.1 DCR2 [Candida margitis]
MLPRRVCRSASYVVFLLFTALILLLLANKHQIVDLNKYVPYDLFASTAPSFFQPPSDSFLLDISINGCNVYNYKNPNCGKPSPEDGKYGDLTEFEGGWIRLKKDLCLGKSWVKKEIFSVKKINHSNYQKLLSKTQLDDEVIVDVAVQDPENDAKIKGNGKLKLPKHVIEDVHKQKKFDGTTQESLMEQNKDDILDGSTPDSAKASYKIGEMNEKVNAEKAGEAKPKGDSTDDGDGDEKHNKREKVSSKDELTRVYYIPTKEELTKSGWQYKSHGIWVKYGPHNSKDAITAFDILFGLDAVDPRPNWNLVKIPVRDACSSSGIPPFITYRRGPKLDYKKEFDNPLVMNDNDEFKILQVADLHFSTGYGKCLNPEPASSASGCKADSRTLEFVNKVLDIEQPDFVVLTGDQIFGSSAPDSETAAFKALSPFIERKIPFALVLGNHDAEGSLKAKELMGLYADLPYSVAAMGPESIDGFGNYMTTVQGKYKSSVALSFYFVDSHAHSQNEKVYPGYDWIKDDQLIYMKEEAESIKDGISEFEKEKAIENGESKNKKHLSMAFFHIPLPEFKNTKKPVIGEHREGVISPMYNSGARDAFLDIGVKAISVGHDHCNDYCLLDEQESATDDNKIWLCYGGGVGLGGYGGYGGYVRRMRTFVLNTAKGEIKSWKRAENEPEKKIDEQVLVSGGNVVNWK